MLKYVALFCLVLGLNVNAQEGPKGPPHERPPRHEVNKEQKQLHEELLKKYDVNKNGKLERDEREKMTPEDRKNLRKAGFNTRGPGRPPQHPSHKDGPPPKKD